MNRRSAALLTALAMLAFAGNSLLCRVALKDAHIDAASFLAIRLLSGAAVLWAVVRLQPGRPPGAGRWWAALALLAYGVCFSFAYLGLTAATGALLLFGAVQATMVGWGLWHGERLRALQLLGLVMALAGLVVLLLPGLAAPPLAAAVLMLAAGAAWGAYTLLAKGSGDPLRATAGNFMRAAPLALAVAAAVSVWQGQHLHADATGASYAIASGALASGLGYAVWYAALPRLRVTTAATVQLSVPVIAAVGGVLWLGEAPSLRLLLAGVVILGGIALVVRPAARRARLSRGAGGFLPPFQRQVQITSSALSSPLCARTVMRRATR